MQKLLRRTENQWAGGIAVAAVFSTAVVLALQALQGAPFFG